MRLTRPRPPSSAHRHRQRGDILLVTMVFLLLCLLGLIGAMRDTMVETAQAGNNLARQRDTQVADLATQYIRNQILADVPAGTPLAMAPLLTSQPWWRQVPATSAAKPPDWQTCNKNGDPANRCGPVTLTAGTQALPYTALVAVQPTGRTDPNSPQCNAGNGMAQAVYYAVFVHVQEAGGATAVNTESVYQACEQLL